MISLIPPLPLPHQRLLLPLLYPLCPRNSYRLNGGVAGVLKSVGFMLKGGLEDESHILMTKPIVGLHSILILEFFLDHTIIIQIANLAKRY